MSQHKAQPDKSCLSPTARPCMQKNQHPLHYHPVLLGLNHYVVVDLAQKRRRLRRVGGWEFEQRGNEPLWRER